MTAFMTAGPKAAAFAALLRVFTQGFGAPAFSAEWVPIFAVLAALTMLLGNIVAIVQQSVKRMLAYSSIAHAGYAFVALVAHNAAGAGSILYYLVAYAFMSLGAFTVLMIVARRDDQRHAFDDYAGLGRDEPRAGGHHVAVHVRLGRAFRPPPGLRASSTCSAPRRSQATTSWP